MSLGTILLVVFVLFLVGVTPRWSQSRNWGYGPSGIVGVALLALVVLVLMDRI